jgi:hypothetical protein
VGQVAFRRLLLEQRAEIGIAVRGMRSRPEHKESIRWAALGGWLDSRPDSFREPGMTRVMIEKDIN